MDATLSKLLDDMNIGGDRQSSGIDLVEQQRYWDGLITKEDRNNSELFVNTLRHLKAIICPICRTQTLAPTDDRLQCFYCGSRFTTRLTIGELIRTIEARLTKHIHCLDKCPQLALWGNNLQVYCESCTFRFILL